MGFLLSSMMLYLSIPSFCSAALSFLPSTNISLPDSFSFSMNCFMSLIIFKQKPLKIFKLYSRNGKSFSGLLQKKGDAGGNPLQCKKQGGCGKIPRFFSEKARHTEIHW